MLRYRPTSQNGSKKLCVFLSLGAELEVQLIAAQKELEELSKQFVRARTAATDKALELTRG